MHAHADDVERLCFTDVSVQTSMPCVGVQHHNNARAANAALKLGRKVRVELASKYCEAFYFNNLKSTFCELDLVLLPSL